MQLLWQDTGHVFPRALLVQDPHITRGGVGDEDLVLQLLVRGRRAYNVSVASESLVHVRVLQVACRILVLPFLRSHFQVGLRVRVEILLAVVVQRGNTFLELQIRV